MLTSELHCASTLHDQQIQGSGAWKRKEEELTHSIQAGLSAGKREGESQRKTSVLHSHVVQEVADAVHNVIEQLEEDGRQQIVI